MIYTEQEWTSHAAKHRQRAEDRLARYRNPGKSTRFMISCLSIIRSAQRI